MGVQRVKSASLVLALVAMIAVGPAAACNSACPLALATGVLVAAGDRLVLGNETGATQEVVWPDGYGVRVDPGGLVLTDRLGTVKGREGDDIRVGGGVDDQGRFRACGDVVVMPPSLAP
jgi:hypothetical protein